LSLPWLVRRNELSPGLRKKQHQKSFETPKLNPIINITLLISEKLFLGLSLISKIGHRRQRFFMYRRVDTGSVDTTTSITDKSIITKNSTKQQNVSIAIHAKPIPELRSVICHQTQVNVPTALP